MIFVKSFILLPWEWGWWTHLTNNVPSTAPQLLFPLNTQKEMKAMQNTHVSGDNIHTLFCFGGVQLEGDMPNTLDI